MNTIHTLKILENLVYDQTIIRHEWVKNRLPEDFEHLHKLSTHIDRIIEKLIRHGHELEAEAAEYHGRERAKIDMYRLQNPLSSVDKTALYVGGGAALVGLLTYFVVSRV